jgi:ribonuclease R
VKRPSRRPDGPPFPTRQQIAAFVLSRDDKVGKREIARAFHLGGEDRDRLDALLAEMKRDGSLPDRPRRAIAEETDLPGVAVLRVVAIDPEGEVTLVPIRWDRVAPPPRIVLAPDRVASAIGDRILAKLETRPDGIVIARAMRRLERGADRQIVGVLRAGRRGDAWIEPVDRRDKDSWTVAPDLAAGAIDGDIVTLLVEAADRPGRRRTRVIARHGRADDPRSAGLIAILAAGIPFAFRPEALAEAQAAEAPVPGERVDLRDLPLVTVDGADARDFDDAVFAEPDPESEGGWHIVVAIADVAHYVRPGSALDRDALERGNSCYFPDRVVPMLPEALSAGLCSLKPGEDRACMAVHLWIDGEGRPTRHRFLRGLMRSRARLTYDQLQAARNGAPDSATAPLMQSVVDPLYGAYAVLARARDRRGTLDLDLPERRVEIDAGGRVTAVGIRPRYDSHRLIEEFMIAANVAAAETLEARRYPTLYRVHAAPERDRLVALKEALEPLGYALALGQVIRPAMFTRILERAQGRPEAPLVNESVLRAQAQAVYSPDNIGHFGLALPRYAHFTSPIRRYADLLVHRGLIAALDLGPDGTTDTELARLDDIGAQVSATERRAAQAERDAVDRYLAAWLSDRLGQVFEARIGGVARFGLFVTLAETGASGLVPISSLPDDFYEHDEAGHRLVGRRWGRVFRHGAAVRARLVEADPLTGSTLFDLVGAQDGADLAGAASAAPRDRRRPRPLPSRRPP